MKVTFAGLSAAPQGHALKAGVVTVLAGVLGIHSGAALAQQPGEATAAPEAPAPQYQQAPQEYQQAPQQYQPQQYPPGYGPPPGYAAPQGYGPPPPPAYRAPPPRYSYYPPPPPPPPRASATERVFTIGGSLGLGVMRFHDNNNELTSGPATGFSGRLGFGIAPRLLLLLGVDGAVTVADNSVYDQSIYYLGLQGFLTQQFFLRGGVGIGNITGQDNYGDFLYFGKTGLGLTGTAGVELLQGYNWSLELAGQLLAGFYKEERWTSGTVQIGFNFF